MFNLKWAVLLFYLFPIFLFGQKQENIFDERLSIIQELIASSNFKQALSDSEQLILNYQNEAEKIDSTTIQIYNTVSYVFLRTGKIDSSIIYANKALEILRDGHEDHIETIKSYNYLGTSHHQAAEFDKAIEALEQGLNIVKQIYGEDHIEATIFYGNLSLSYNAIGKPKKAIQCLEKNLKILLNLYGENHINVAKTYNNFGAVYFSLGDFDKVLDYSFKTLKIKQQILGDNHPTLSSSYVNIGSMYQEKGDYEKSIVYAEKGIQIILNSLGETHPHLTHAHKVIGGSYKRIKSHKKAIEHYEKGIDIIEQNFGKDHFRAGGIYHELADLHNSMKNYEEAIKFANKSLDIFSKNNGKNNKDVATSYELLGSISISKDEPDQAIEYYNEALNFYTSHTLKGPDIANPYMNIGMAYSIKNDFEKANYYYNKCAEALQYNLNQPTLFHKVTNRVALRKLLKIMRQDFEKRYVLEQDKKYLDSILINDQHAIALEDFFQGELSEREAREFHFSDSFWRYEKAINNILQKNDNADLHFAFEIAEKSKSRFLAENFRSISAKKIAGISQELLNQEHQINIDLAFFDKKLYQEKYENATPNDSLISLYKDKLFVINQEKERLVETFKEKYPAYHNLKYDCTVTTVSEIQSILEDDQALIEYLVGDSTIFVFVITAEQYHVEAIRKDFPLEKGVLDFRENIYSYWMLPGQSDEVYLSQNAAFVKNAFQLYDRLMEPIESVLPEKLIIVPDGILNLIPFEALLKTLPKDAQDFKSHDYLLKHHQISYNYSASLYKELSNRKNASSSAPFVAFAPSFVNEDSVYNSLAELRSGLGPLKYNMVEAQTVHSLLGGDIYEGTEATESQFLQYADQYQIIHLSTHGKSNDEMGDYSFVCFSEIPDSISDNERLYVRELYNLKLNADMVVLSACETGLGQIKRGEGIIGLASGFTFAGAASTVTSLWSVNDIQTTHLMERFYKNIKAGMTKDGALRRAKLDFLNEESHSEPYFWSAFVAAGNMAPIELQNERTWWYVGFILLGLAGIGILFRNFSIF